MKTRNGAIAALLLLATCTETSQEPTQTTIAAAQAAMGKVPGSEVATWQKVGSSTIPDLRYLQAAAFDTARKVVVMFGGTNYDPSSGTAVPNQETWEWNPATAKWTNRTIAGSAPDARSGAAMVYDSKRSKVILFGGRAGSGYNYEDTWEWDPTTGAWTDVASAGSHPSARSQHAMVYEASTGKVFLFGGGRSDSASYDATGVIVSLADAWELDPVAHAWTQVTAAGPSARHDLGMVWDSARNKAVLFGGMQIDISGVTGIPKQDTWEWDPATSTWSERTSQGSKPGARYAHSMAYDGSRSKVLVFGGFDISTGGSLNDLWEWDPASGAWSERLTGSEAGVPSGRRYASLLSDDSRGRLDLVAGALVSDSYKGGTGGIIIYPPTYGNGITGSRDVWELDPSKTTFTDRTSAPDVPSARWSHCMAYYPPTGKVYMFGGIDQLTGQYADDLWAWDGKVWAMVSASVSPGARSDAAMAYDPTRKSLILFGGNTNNGTSNETWEWTASNGWSELFPTTSPDPLVGHGMATDTTRNKVLLFAGVNYSYWYGGPVYQNPMRNDVWEWDGIAATWSNRSANVSSAPSARQYPLMSYDEGQKKLFVYDGTNYNSAMGIYWEWDPVTGGWAMRDTGDNSMGGYANLGGYDSIRRRQVLMVQNYNSSSNNYETWELDTNSQTWYIRSISSPPMRYNAAMAFDAGRGVMVMFGGELMNSPGATDDTWEYKVTGAANGEGCTAGFASSCASGYCVDGVCCDAAACTGPCKSCNVHGSEGTCVAVQAGTEVAGSCSDGQACDGNGKCMASNGHTCSSAADCASGHCVDGVCCDTACAGACFACNQTGHVGKCTPFAAGSDPQNECGKGTGACKSTCDGVSGCGFPQTTVSCGDCMMCDGSGSCSYYDPYCYKYGTGGSYYPTGGTGGYVYPTGGTGGYSSYPTGGSGGYTTARGGSGGSVTSRGGAGGTLLGGGGALLGGSGGLGTARGGSAGTGMGGGTVIATGGVLSHGGAFGSGGLGVGGALAGYGGNLGVGGSLGGPFDGGPDGATKRDATNGPDLGDITTEARLHRSGCSCELGQSAGRGSGFTTPLLLCALGVLLRLRRRR